MTQKQESKLRTEIKQALIVIGATCHVYHGSPMGERGHSDLYGTYRGRAYWFEVKPPGWKPENQPTRDRFVIQCDFLDREEKAGAITGVVHSPELALRLLEVDKPLDKYCDKGESEPIVIP